MTAGVIYAIESGGFIKIGWSKNPWPHESRLVGVRSATPADEKAIQKHFSTFRMRSEWFHNDDVVQEFLRTLSIVVKPRASHWDRLRPDGYFFSPESRAKMSASAKAQHALRAQARARRE